VAQARAENIIQKKTAPPEMITILIHRLHDFIMRFNSQKSSEEMFWSQSEFFILEITNHPQTPINTRSEGFFCFCEYSL
jgi:hypothetical protein